MQNDLDILNSKSKEELAAIAQAMNITGNHTKAKLIELISKAASGEATAEESASEAPAPKRRGRRPKSEATKVQIEQPAAAEVQAANAVQATEPAEVSEPSEQATDTAPAQPKKRGRKAKSKNSEATPAAEQSQSDSSTERETPETTDTTDTPETFDNAPIEADDDSDTPSRTQSEGKEDFMGIIDCEGVLEIIPDGYGFLRSADYNYLNSPDDI